MEINALRFTPTRYKQDAATLGRYALHMVDRWRETVNRHPDSVLFRAKLQTWRDIAGNPSSFINT